MVMTLARLDGRRVIGVTGPDATHLLHNVLTCDIENLSPRTARAGALLSPQGKIQTDLMIMRDGEDGYVIDLPDSEADAFLKRMVMYRLRSKVQFVEQNELVAVASFDPDSGASEVESDASGTDSGFARDERFGAVPVFRAIMAIEGAPAPDTESHAAWHRFRVIHGIAECGADYAIGDAFPHDAAHDQTGGVDFRKGCYVGQEVVSRMQHRGTARRRPVVVTPVEGALPASGTEILADGKPAGILGTVTADGHTALAIVRLDRIADAVASGAPVAAGETPIICAIPPRMTYAFPQDGAGDSDG